MDLKKLYQDDDAVSPVIGVILMVAITVILAAVIASFVLNLGGETSTTPQASWEFEFSESTSGSPNNDLFDSSTETSGYVTITHDSGDSIQRSRITIVDDDSGSTDVEGSSEFPNTQISSGDSVELEIGTDDTLRIIYTDDSGEDSTTLATWEAPDA